MKRILILAALLFISAVRAQAPEAPALTLGIEKSEMTKEYEKFISDTVPYLREALKDKYVLNPLILSSEELRKEAERNRLDLVIAPASTSRKGILRGTREIATAVTEYSHNPNFSSGSVFLVAGTKSHPKHLKEFKGASVITSREFGFLGLDAIRSAVALSTESDPDKFFSSVRYTDPDVKSILEELKKGSGDIAVLPVCALETYSSATGEDTGWLRVLEPRQNAELDCLHSTLLFPGITVFSFPSLPPEASRLITRALLYMPQGEGFAWEIATDFSNVDAILLSLNQDAWAEQRQWSVVRFLKEHWEFFAAGLLVLILLAAHSVRTEFVVRRRTADLRNALIVQQELRKQARVANRRFEKLQKISTIGQLSSMLAHELRQPLNAINCYAAGLKNFMGDNLPAFASKGIEEIEAQSLKASQIVEKVRDYVRARSNRSTLQDFSALITQSIKNFHTTSLGDIKIIWKNPGPFSIHADELEMELIITNLMRNSAQAQEGQKNPWIKIELEKAKEKPNYVRMTVTDNGSPLTEEAFSRIITTGDTSKPEGLGLGLSLVRSLTEAHSGRMEISKTKKGSLKVAIDLPLAEENENVADKDGKEGNHSSSG